MRWTEDARLGVRGGAIGMGGDWADGGRGRVGVRVYGGKSW